MSTLQKYQFLQLLEKHRQGSCSPAEEELLYGWFEQVAIFDELTFVSEEEKEKIKSEIGNAIGEKTGLPGFATEPVKKLSIRKLFPMGIAAALVLCLFAAYFLLQRDKAPQMILVSAPSGVRKMPVTLPDSSVVWLTGGSSIRFPEHFGRNLRPVKLEGTAFFSVRHNERAPFTVTAGPALSVKVLGTSFLITEDHEELGISVVTGKVQVNDGEQKLSVLLPGEKLLYSGRNKKYTTGRYSSDELKEWKENDLIYLDNISVRELSIVLQTLYSAQLHYDEQQMAARRFHLSFSRKLALDELLDLLRTASGLDFERTGKEITINTKH